MNQSKELNEALPAILDACANEIAGPQAHLDLGRYSVSVYTLVSEWRPFSEAFSIPPVAGGSVQQRFKELDLSEQVSSLPGVSLQADSKVIARYSGDSHGGSTDFIVRDSDGSEASLSAALAFESTLTGVLGAFYVAHILPTKGRYWHGLYGYDYRILFKKSSIVDWLRRAGFTGEDAPVMQVLDHPASVCVSVSADKVDVSAYGAGETTPLCVFRASIVNGRLQEISRKEVLRSRIIVLY